MEGLNELTLLRQNGKGIILQLNLEVYNFKGNLVFNGIDMDRQLIKQGYITIKESSCRAIYRKDGFLGILRNLAYGRTVTKVPYRFTAEKAEDILDYKLRKLGTQEAKTFLRG